MRKLHITFLFCLLFSILLFLNTQISITAYFEDIKNGVWKLKFISQLQKSSLPFPNVSFLNTPEILSKTINSETLNALSFVDAIQNFPWDNYKFNENVTSPSEMSKLENLTQTLFHQVLLPYLILEPKELINQTCCVPFPETLSYMKCKPLNKTRKVGVLLQFGFDVDVLEIHLNELYDIVDQFFIIESTTSHFRGVRKPLLWNMIYTQTRFFKFKNKITHFTLDDSDSVFIRRSFVNTGYEKPEWEMELIQERARWTKFIVWNNGTNFFGDDDLLGFGDTDEIPNRNVIHHLKTCEIEHDPVDIGIWFPYGNIKQAFRSDFPVQNHPFTLGDPTYWTLKRAKSFYKVHNHQKFPSRNRGKSSGFLLGGIHMTYYGYLPFLLAKLLSKTEADPKLLINDIFETIKSINKTNVHEIERKVAEFRSENIVSLQSLFDRNESGIRETAILPWFYDCNRKRYPAWEGKPDARLY